MMNSTLPQIAMIYTNAPSELAEFVPESLDIHYYSSVKKLKKALRSNTPEKIFFHIIDAQSESDSIEIVDYVRTALASHSSTLVIFVSDTVSTTPSQIMNKADVDDVIRLNKEDTTFVQRKIARIIKRIIINKKHLMEKDAQVNMLTSVNRFSHQRQNIQALIASYAEALLQFCGGHSGLVVTPAKVTSVQTSQPSISQSQLDTVDDDTKQYIINLALQCKAPVVNLSPELEAMQALIEILPNPVASYLVFPLIVYNNNLASIICFISEDALDSVSTTQLNVMRDASLQLKIILERRFAESRMATHYQRLKETLAELQTTQNHLIHAEKMASVGHMAAGIAHEINNPLAFVISNFDPLDHYVETLISMVDLHEQLIQSINEIEQPVNQKLTQSIQSFKQTSEIDFVTEDIKALVHDSKEGLLRVRDIISDLGSYSRKESLENQLLNLSEVISETVRMLKYELSDEVEVQLLIDSDIQITSHKGFIQQILANLVKNAIQAHATSDKQTQQKIIKVEVTEKTECVLINVSDNAGGIPEKSRKHVFDPFFTTKDVGKGTGMGLSVCSNLAKKMHGTLTLAPMEESNDLDTTFTLKLPKQVGDE
ncbi:phospho-acceptor domain-containing protein [Alteromonas sp. 76-1]|uniref:sensor histidine kinase n=1 Tax=Alteromonas sp. 76-1 TaxID=2358187 RepID=UPI000FD177E4|nr:ATP-binding protein [Alteromonas sp. 76-1]VEL98360.1 phospho-acceptor domain-containing protein [Alteromonas sp. 76-1]